MTVATFLQTNFNVQAASTYKGAIDGNFAVLIRQGVMFAPSSQGSPNMTVLLAAGHVFNGTTLTEIAPQSTGTIVAPVSNPRIDRVVLDQTTGAVSVVTGTPAASPVAPAIPAGKCPIAQVALTSSTTSITDSIITDERDFTGLGGQSSQSPYGVSTNSTNAYSVTTSPVFTSVGSGGQRLFLKINATNTGSATINPNAIGAITIKDNQGNNVAAGALLANSIYEFIYDGTNFILLNGTKPYFWLPYGADSGAANAYVLSPSPAILAYAAGQAIVLKPANANTTASTLAVSGLTAKSIKLGDGTDPPANSLLTTGCYILIYDGTNFVLTNPSGGAFTANSGKIVLGAVTIQWGTQACSYNVTETVTFPVAYSGTPYCITATVVAPTATYAWSVSNFSTTGFNFFAFDTGFFNWLSIGPT